jgi:hypothetical protein
MGRDTSCVVRYPSATIQSTKVSASSKRLLDQRHDEIAIMVFKIENTIQAKQKTDTRMSQTQAPAQSDHENKATASIQRIIGHPRSQ